MKKTIVLKVDSQQPEIDKVRVAADFIKKGGLVAFPTETVYGLGADALNPEAVRTLFEAKKRPFDNPPIVHVGHAKGVHRLAGKVSPKAERLMKTFWPGPLTLIFMRSEIVPDVTVCGLDTIAIRMPRHNVALALIRESGCSIAAPSANLAGKPSPTTAKHVLHDLDGRIDAVLDAGPTHIGVESTVLDMTVDPPQILRPGGTPYEVLKKILGRVKLHPVAVAEKAVPIEKARSPGVKHKHYAPDADVIVVEGELSAVANKVKKLAEFYVRKGSKVGVLATDETVSHYKADVVKSLGSRSDLAVIARNLFRLLREFDLEGVDVIIAEGVPAEGLGLAVLNRLRKASGYKIVRASSR
ncbi:MAG: L-threonylcarbamoyladenylate synthase [Candidatus Bathyarchaeota archaeon]|nr:L-threonylcarbamoyladenylate synthase [Candidatus Bathyarchaeota archaeon]MDH5596117.1 L-threonylcarbamoyladenylate synthase [Candidatus Bathyarchaeota archaeon]